MERHTRQPHPGRQQNRGLRQEAALKPPSAKAKGADVAAIARSLAEHPLLRLAVDAARQRGQSLWLTGGGPRDLLLGLTPPDFDLTADGDALELGRYLAHRHGARYVPLGERHATCRVVFAAGYLDICGLRARDITTDLTLRDFTVNALALPLTPLEGRPEMIDPTGGRDDLAKGLLRPAGPHSLTDDPLRVLRAFRFMSSHGFSPAPGVEALLKRAAPGLFRVARERIGFEWRAMMAGKKAAAALWAMDRAQILTRLVPELAPGKKMLQNRFHHLDVFDHSLETVAAVEAIADDPDCAGLGPEAALYLRAPETRAVLKTAALFHDLGKPPTRVPSGPDEATFHRHDALGGRMARRRARKLGFSKAQATVVRLLTAQHMRPLHLLALWRRDNLSDRALRRLLVQMGDHLAGSFIVCLADTMAGKGPERPKDAEEKILELFALVIRRRDEQLAAELAAPPLISGRNLIAAGMEPGPPMGRALKRARQAQLDGEITSRAEALQLALETLKTKD